MGGKVRFGKPPKEAEIRRAPARKRLPLKEQCDRLRRVHEDIVGRPIADLVRAGRFDTFALWIKNNPDVTKAAIVSYCHDRGLAVSPSQSLTSIVTTLMNNIGVPAPLARIERPTRKPKAKPKPKPKPKPKAKAKPKAKTKPKAKAKPKAKPKPKPKPKPMAGAGGLPKLGRSEDLADYARRLRAAGPDLTGVDRDRIVRAEIARVRPNGGRKTPSQVRPRKDETAQAFIKRVREQTGVGLIEGVERARKAGFKV